MKTTWTGHFYLGQFVNQERAEDFFRETWDEDDEDREHTPLTEFASSQGQRWYDHDFLEWHLDPSAKTVQELVAGASWHAQWVAELARRAAMSGITANAFVFIEESQITHPRSVVGNGFSLQYMGRITFPI